MRKDLTILAGWLIDGKGSPARTNVLLTIRKGRLESVNSVDPGVLPDLLVKGENSSAQFRNFSDSTIIPGLIDCHVHLAFSGTSDGEARARQLRHLFENALPLIREHVSSHLTHGIVAVRDGGDAGSLALRFARDIVPSQHDAPLRVRACGQAWHAQGRYGSFLGRTLIPGFSLAQSLVQHPLGDHIKIIQSGMNSLRHFGQQSPPQFSTEALTETVQTARSLGCAVMVHANGRQAVAAAIEAGVHSVEHGFFMEEENLARLADRQIVWIPTAVTMQALARELPAGSTEADIARRTFEQQLEQMTAARRLGVPVCLGTDSGCLGVHHGRSLPDEFQLFLEAGYTVEEIVQAATERAAKLLGLEQSLGALAPNRPAAFVVVPGPPEELPASLLRQPALYVLGD